MQHSRPREGSSVQPISARPLVADDRFVLATRDTGYRSLAASVAELLDNSIQASAKTLRISVFEERRLFQTTVIGAIASAAVALAPGMRAAVRDRRARPRFS